MLGVYPFCNRARADSTATPNARRLTNHVACSPRKRCPCGFHGDPKRECRCGPVQISKHRQKISGPLLDRIDLHVEVPLIEYKELADDQSGESSAEVRKRVENARAIQQERFKNIQGVNCNSAMPPKQMREHCQIDAESSQFMEQAMTELNFSARAHDRILKVARTLADLEGSANIQSAHILEAIQYRSLDRSMWT
jgi:magnesium chelatase family protein